MKNLLLAAGLFIVLAVVLGCISTSGQTQTANLSSAEQACISSGGNVTTASCCGSASDFPNLCAIGACGCSPSNSHPVKTCDCGEGRCFDGNACVAMQVPAGNTSPGASGTGNTEITIYNFQFNPQTVNVTVGTTVVWTNNDTVAHSVVAFDQSFKSNPLQPGESYSYTFETAGIYAYHCGIHPSMRGTIVVS